jgi:murein L,D-transpeptidase YcbB/YkuD
MLCMGCGAFPQMDLPPPDDGAEALHRRLRAISVPADERTRLRDGWLGRFYQRRDGQPAWTGAHGVHARVDELLFQLDTATGHGLDPEMYGRTELRAAVADLRVAGDHDATVMSALDIGCTAAFLAFADDLRRGAVDPAAASVSWGVRRPSADLSGLLATAISIDQVGVNLQRMAPTSPEYRRLQQALGDLTPAMAAEADILRANLERWRWLPRDLGSQYLLVRIADFELDIVSDGPRRTKLVILGEPIGRRRSSPAR